MKAIRFAALALLAPCVALANQTDDVKAGGGTVIPSIGMSIDVVGNSALENHTGSSHAIDLGYTYAHAKRTQDRNTFDGQVIFGGQTFLGSAGDIEWTSNVQLAHIGYRPRVWFGQSNFALEGVLGVGWARLGLKGVADSGQTASEHMSNFGYVLGLGGIWRFARATSLQLRILGFGSGKDEGVTSASRGDLSVTHAFTRNFQGRIGFGYLSAYSAREDNNNNIVKSPIRAGGGGVMLGVDFVF